MDLDDDDDDYISVCSLSLSLSVSSVCRSVCVRLDVGRDSKRIVAASPSGSFSSATPPWTQPPFQPHQPQQQQQQPWFQQQQQHQQQQHSHNLPV